MMGLRLTEGFGYNSWEHISSSFLTCSIDPSSCSVNRTGSKTWSWAHFLGLISAILQCMLWKLKYTHANIILGPNAAKETCILTCIPRFTIIYAPPNSWIQLQTRAQLKSCMQSTPLCQDTVKSHVMWCMHFMLLPINSTITKMGKNPKSH